MATIPVETGHAENNIRRRIGRFTMSHALIENEPLIALAALQGCLVVRAEAVHYTRSIDYVAMHADFDECPSSEVPPLYLRVMTRHEDGEITVTWKRA